MWRRTSGSLFVSLARHSTILQPQISHAVEDVSETGRSWLISCSCSVVRAVMLEAAKVRTLGRKLKHLGDV